MSAKQVVKTIRKYSKFLITSHINLEGDALGSGLALASLLRKLGKDTIIVSEEAPPSIYHFLSGSESVRQKLGAGKFEVAFVIDCPNKERVGDVAKLLGKEKLIVNIDHHRDNKKFGQINWVNPQASSAGEMIYHLFKLMRIKLDRNDALNIYTAILTDTGSFRHANTTSAVFRICSKLVEFGIEPVKVYGRIYENNSVQDVLLLVKIISQLSFGVNNRLAWVKITQDIFRKIADKHEIIDKVFDYAKSVRTVKVVLIFAQKNSRIVKVSLRSKSPIDVQKVASDFGGGGHKFASGCLIKSGLQEAEKGVLARVRRLLRR